MTDKDCRSEDCEAHLFMLETVRDLKTLTLKLADGQQSLERAVVKLSENFNEIMRTNARLDEILKAQAIKEKAQDVEIEANRNFMNKAVGALATVSFVVPIALFFAGMLLK